MLQMVLLQKLYLDYGIIYRFVAMLFATPYITFSILLSFVYIFMVRRKEEVVGTPYTAPAMRSDLYLVIGEFHWGKDFF